jgi:hypothetical protein
MAVGDSFFVPCCSAGVRAEANRVSSAAARFTRYSGDGLEMEFTTRTLRDDATGDVVGIRCWRTK